MNLIPSRRQLGAAFRKGLAGAMLVLLAGRFPLWAADAEAPNLVANGDFSQVSGGKPDKWELSGNQQDVTQTLQVVKDKDQKAAAQLACARCEPRSPSSHAMLAQVGAVKLVKGRMYEFSCRMREEGLRGRSTSVAFQDTKDWTNCGLYEQFTIGVQWKTYKRVFFATRDVGPTGRLQIWFNEPGALYVADVRIVECRQEEVEFTDLIPARGGRNLVPNGSFEVGQSGWSSMGAGTGWGDLDQLHGKVEATGGSRGRSFLRIPLGEGQTPVLYFDYFEPVARRELRPLAATKGWIKVEKGSAYTLSCDMRAGEEDVRAVLGARARDPAGGRNDHKLTVKLTKVWKRYSLTFRPEHRFVFVFVGPDLAQEQRVDVDVDAVQLEKGEQATDFQPRSEVEFAAEPSHDGGIIEEGQKAFLVLRACNHGQAPARAAVSFQVADFEDKPVQWPGESLEIPAGSTVRREREIPADWKGFYRVRASAEVGGKTESADIRLAIVPRRTSKDSACGINHAFTSARLINLASKAGVTWYRDWSLKWQHIEPAKGEFRWEVGDAQIDRVLREGANVLPLLPPFPSADWASEAPPNLPTKGYPGVRLRQAWAPKDPNDLAAFVARAVARYKDRIRLWEFLNEPIYTDYSLPADHAGKYGGKRYAVADYVALLDVAARGMRKADPTCKVMGGIGTGPGGLTREVVRAGCLKHADILNLHMYPGARSPETYAGEMDELLALMDAHGGRKPVWITEFSYYGADDLPRRPFFPAAGSWSEQRLLESERQCADFTVRYFAIMLSRGVQKIFIHSGAGGKVNEPNFECALFACDGAPRKLFPAMAVFTELLGAAPSPAGVRKLGESGHCAAFETGRRSVLVLWKEDEASGGTVTEPSSSDLPWLDAMGRRITSQPINLSSSVIYLVGQAGKAKELLESIRFLGAESSPAPSR